MNKRILKKRAARFSAAVLSLPLTVAHAKPSFFRLNVGYQRRCLAHRMHTGLGVGKDVANYVARRYWP